MKVNRKIQPLPVRDTAVEVAINHWEQKHLPLSSPSPLPPDATPSHKVKIKNLGEMTHDSRPPTSNVIQATLISMCVSVTHQYFRSCHKDFFFFYYWELWLGFPYVGMSTSIGQTFSHQQNVIFCKRCIHAYGIQFYQLSANSNFNDHMRISNRPRIQQSTNIKT